MKFSILIYQNGISSDYGNETNLSLDNAIDSLMYYDCINQEYTKKEIENKLTKMNKGFTTFGSAFFEVKLTKH